ncbi:MAG TPA: ABC transporter permease [Treponema sp.]|nr:ABC transporter permease [Treponema sp.]
MVREKTAGSTAFNTFLYALLILLAVTCLYPLWYAFCLSISDKSAANSGLVTIMPVGFSLASYKEIMGDAKFFNSFLISVERTVFGTLFSLVVMILLGYPLSKTKREFPLRNMLLWFLMFCMLFNAGAIPWYITMVKYHLLDSITGLILAGSLPVFYQIILMNFFKSIPGELEEAARVDGAGPWRILIMIIVPCSVPVIATMILFVSVGYWNEFFQGLVLSSGDRHYPLQTYIQQMVISTQNVSNLTPDQLKLMSRLSNKSLDAAKVFIAMIPMLVVYPFIQKYFVRGIILGAIKG